MTHSAAAHTVSGGKLVSACASWARNECPGPFTLTSIEIVTNPSASIHPTRRIRRAGRKEGTDIVFIGHLSDSSCAPYGATPSVRRPQGPTSEPDRVEVRPVVERVDPLARLQPGHGRVR